MKEPAAAPGPRPQVAGHPPDAAARLRAVAEQHPHVLRYLQSIPLDRIGVPDFYPEATKRLSTSPTAISSTASTRTSSSDILEDAEDARDYYISIEPSMGIDLQATIRALEPYLLDYVDELEAAKTDEEKKTVLTQAVEEYFGVEQQRQRPQRPFRLQRQERREERQRRQARLRAGRGGEVPDSATRSAWAC